jgi:hypothetical protein
VLSFTQKLRIGLVFCRLYCRNPFVRAYSNFLACFAPRKYRLGLQFLSS